MADADIQPSQPPRPPQQPPEPPNLDGVWRAAELTWPLTSTVGPGLHGAVAGGTRVAWHDRTTGQVAYRSHSLATLRGCEPDELAYVLLTGRRPADETADAAGTDGEGMWPAAREAMQAAARLPSEVIEWLALTERRDNPLRLLRAGLSAIGCHAERTTFPPNAPRLAVLATMRLVGHVAGFVKVLGRRRMGHPLQREYEEDLTVSERVLTETRALPPTRAQVALLNDILLCLADADLSPGAFAGVVVASCLADWHTSVVAALSGFEGEVVEVAAAGGAGTAGETDAVADERRQILAEVLQRLPAATPTPGSASPAAPAAASAPAPPLAVERASITALALEALRRLGVMPELVPCVYAFGRTLGLAARLHELRADNRIYRPLARYVGPPERHVPVHGMPRSPA